MEDHYVKTIECENCGKRETCPIPKGTPVYIYILNYTCLECGCKKMFKVIS